jgi:translin
MPDSLLANADGIRGYLETANKAREAGLAACRRVIRASGQSIRAVHRHEGVEALRLRTEAAEALHEAQQALKNIPQVNWAGFLQDAEKEYAEAVLTNVLIEGDDLPSTEQVGVGAVSWLHGLAEAASELRRHLLDSLRRGELDNAEQLLQKMSDVCDVLMTFDYPDALTAGLRRTTDALRAVVERTRGDVTTTLTQARLQWAIENRKD